MEVEQEERKLMATKDETWCAGVGNRNIQFAEKAEVSLFVRHVCARPSRHFGPVQTPSVVARASSAVDSSGCQSARGLASRAQRWERDGTSDRSARERTKRARRRVAGFLIPPLWVTKARNPPLVLPPRSCCRSPLDRCGWVGIPTNK